jgi:tetratricopeptide (TPR) repeat protein
MPRSVTSWRSLILLSSILCGMQSMAQTAPRPLRASEVMALEAGGALQANIAHDIATRGLNFHPAADFVTLMKRAGADESVLRGLLAAKVDGTAETKPDQQTLEQLSQAAVLMKAKKYAEATTLLSNTLDRSFARMETGFVMAELLRQREQFDTALSVYGEILSTQPDFPEVHVKASYLLYRVGDTNDALNEAKAALKDNPDDAEAHKNMALALEEERKLDAAIAQYQEALRIKPDYAVIHYDLGNLYYEMHSYDQAIAEYRKCLVIDPGNADAHTNLGLAYKDKGDVAAAVPELREAKRLKPDDPAIRQDLASALMSQSPASAIPELQELEQKFPKFEMCHICLARAFAWNGDNKSAEAEFMKAGQLDPTDPNAYLGLGDMQEKQKNYDAALEQYRIAEKVSPDSAEAHQAVGRVLLAKKDFQGAADELKQAETLSQTSADIHELYGQALRELGQIDLAIGEFKEAIALDPTYTWVMTRLALALEKKGDWVGALEQYRKAVLTDEGVGMKAKPGQPFRTCDSCTDQYSAAQGRFADYLVSLKAAGHTSEAADLQKRVALLDTEAGTTEKVEMAIKTGDQAFQERKIDGAEKSYKEAVDLAGSLPPGDENLIVALGRLGNAYAMEQKFTDAAAAFHRQLAVIEQTFGSGSERSVEPLRFLGQIAAMQKNYKEGESYVLRALDISLKMAGDNNPRAVESLRMVAGFYESQNDWSKAEPYLLRAVKGAESSEPQMVLVPLWGLCDMYDRWGKPDKSQSCYHRATEILETQYGYNSPNLTESLKNEAQALRKLGRNAEAEVLEERMTKIQRTAQNN